MKHNPLMPMVDQLIPEIKDAFQKRFGILIFVDVKKVTNAEGHHSVDFSFRHTKPGMLPTALEKMFFETWIQAYQTATQLAITLIMAEETKPKEDDTIN